MREKQLCRHAGQARRRGRRCSRCWSRDSPAACGEDHSDGGGPRVAHGGPHAGAGDVPEAGCDPVGGPR